MKTMKWLLENDPLIQSQHTMIKDDDYESLYHLAANPHLHPDIKKKLLKHKDPIVRHIAGNIGGKIDYEDLLTGFRDADDVADIRNKYHELRSKQTAGIYGKKKSFHSTLIKMGFKGPWKGEEGDEDTGKDYSRYVHSGTGDRAVVIHNVTKDGHDNLRIGGDWIPSSMECW